MADERVPFGLDADGEGASAALSDAHGAVFEHLVRGCRFGRFGQVTPCPRCNHSGRVPRIGRAREQVISAIQRNTWCARIQ